MSKVILTEPAEYDLIEIEYYIHVHLCNPEAALRITDGILNKAEQLGYFPKEHPYVADELLGNVGVRMTSFDNYNIFYYYDEKLDRVHIIRILYSKADWKDILK